MPEVPPRSAEEEKGGGEMVAKEGSDAQTEAVEDVLKKGISIRDAARIHEVKVAALGKSVRREIEVVVGHSAEEGWSRADFERMHEEGFSPRTAYTLGCRCAACEAAHIDLYRKNARLAAQEAEKAAAEVRLKKLMEAARGPIKDLPIHGVGLVTIMPDGRKTIDRVPPRALSEMPGSEG